MATNDDSNNEVVSIQAMRTHFSKIRAGTSNLPYHKQMELIDTLQIQFNNLVTKLKNEVSARAAHQTAPSRAYPYCGSCQSQGSDWKDIHLHDAGSYGSGPGSFSNMSSSSSPRVTTTTSSVSSTPSSSVEKSSAITQYVQAICEAIKSLWLQVELKWGEEIYRTILFVLKDIVMRFFP